MSKQAFDAKIQALEDLRAVPGSAVDPLRKALRERNNFLVSKAAALIGDLHLAELVPDVLAAFDRFLVDAAKSDPQCWAKNAMVKALKDLEHQDAEVYRKGIMHIQMEPVWGGQVDTAATLRGACALALSDCRLDDVTLLTVLADALADPEKSVRVEVALALSRAGLPEATALLRLKALSGDPEPEVIGQCLASLLALNPRDGIPFAVRFLHGKDDELRMEAAAALAQTREPAALDALKEFSRSRLSADLRRALLTFLAASPQREAAEFLFSLGTADALAALKKSRYRGEFPQVV
ncbi:MAG: HEAT repeat domain-containing protein [Acidobacteriota bacterium]